MADLSPPATLQGPGTGRTPRDRGQLLLVTAVGLATLLVGLSVVLNTAIYTETMVAGGDTGHAGAVEYREDAASETADRLRYTNRRNDTSYAALESNLSARVGAWSRLTGRQAAVDGRARNVSVAGVTRGTRVVGTDPTRTLTNESGDPDWGVVPGATAVRGVRLNVSRASLVDADTSDATAVTLAAADPFRVVLDDGTDRWRVFVYQDGSGDVLAAVVDDTGTLSAPCRVPAGGDGYATVSLSNATLGATDCPALAVLDEPSGSFDVRFVEGTDAVGSYTLVADRPRSAVADGDFGAATADPVARPALYAVRVTVTETAPALDYETTVRVVPGETDD